MFVSTSGWYASLHKPAWNPPSWLFGPAWILLYVMMAKAVWLVWCEGGLSRQARPLGLFIFQLWLNAFWTPLFFGMHHLGVSFIEISLMWIAIITALRSFWLVNRLASLVLIPYLGWVSFAAALNFAIRRLNS
jgi:benzodiazapine receptor